MTDSGHTRILPSRVSTIVAKTQVHHVGDPFEVVDRSGLQASFAPCQASVKALEDCIHEASVGLQNMPLTSLASVSPITGQDSSPGGSSARLARCENPGDTAGICVRLVDRTRVCANLRMEQAVVTSAAPCSQARAPGPENATREGTPSKNAALHIDDLISGSVQGPGLRTMEV